MQKRYDCTRDTALNYLTLGSTGISYQRQGVDGRYSNCGISSYGKISLFTRDKTGTLVELEDGDRVFNSTYFECRSFELCGDRPGVDLFWSFDNLLDDDKTISPVHAVINDYQISTFGFVPDFTYNITCKSRRTGEEISVITTSFRKCIIFSFFMYIACDSHVYHIPYSSPYHSTTPCYRSQYS